MHAPIYILSGSQTDFARNWAREELEIYDLFAEALQDAVLCSSRRSSRLKLRWAMWATSWVTCLRVRA